MIYGTDIQALTDLPDPEVLCSENVAGAYACARRLVTEPGALADVGEIGQYDSINLNNYLGASTDLNDPTVIGDLQSQASQVVLEEPFAAGANVVASFGAGVLTTTTTVQGNPGPLFQLVIPSGAPGVTAQLLLPGQV